MCLRAKFLTGLVAGILGIGCSGSSTEDAYIEQAGVIHQNALTIDGHIEIPANYATREVDPGRDNDFQVDLPKLLAGEIKAIFLLRSILFWSLNFFIVLGCVETIIFLL